MSMSWIATSARPSPCPGSRSQGAYGPGRVTCRVQESERRAPSAPVTASSRSFSYSGQNRRTCPTISVTPASAATEIIRSAAARSSAIGFSQRTCFPARAAATVACSWRAVGTHTDTAAISVAERRVQRRSPRDVPPLREPPRAILVGIDDESEVGARDPRPRLSVDAAGKAGTQYGDFHSRCECSR